MTLSNGFASIDRGVVQSRTSTVADCRESRRSDRQAVALLGRRGHLSEAAAILRCHCRILMQRCTQPIAQPLPTRRGHAEQWNGFRFHQRNSMLCHQGLYPKGFTWLYAYKAASKVWTVKYCKTVECGMVAGRSFEPYGIYNWNIFRTTEFRSQPRYAM